MRYAQFCACRDVEGMRRRTKIPPCDEECPQCVGILNIPHVEAAVKDSVRGIEKGAGEEDESGHERAWEQRDNESQDLPLAGCVAALGQTAWMER